MFSGRDQHAFFLQAGCVTHLGYIASNCFHLEAIKINPVKHNAGTRRSRKYPQPNRRTAMETYTLALHRCTDCLLEWQVILDKQINTPPRKEWCGILATLSGKCAENFLVRDTGLIAVWFSGICR